MGRQPLVPGERICMPELFVNCKALSPNEELFLAGNLSCKRLCRLFRELTLGTSDFGAQFVGCFFSAWAFSFVCSLTFVELCTGPWGFNHRVMGAQIRRPTGPYSEWWVISWGPVETLSKEGDHDPQVKWGSLISPYSPPLAPTLWWSCFPHVGLCCEGLGVLGH